MAHAPLSEDARRERSGLVFGNAYMLETCAAIFSGRRVNLSSIAKRWGETNLSLYEGPLKKLVEAQLLTDVQREAGDDRRTRWFMPDTSPLWKMARELLK